MKFNTSKKYHGFTLIEMLVVVAIIAILAAIAIPSYQHYVLRSHRVEARNALLEAGNQLARIKKVHNAYNRNSSGNECNASCMNGELTRWGINEITLNGNPIYRISFANLDASTYQLQAVAMNSQASDDCRIFYLDQNGGQKVNYKGSIQAVRAPGSRECWGK